MLPCKVANIPSPHVIILFHADYNRVTASTSVLLRSSLFNGSPPLLAAESPCLIAPVVHACDKTQCPWYFRRHLCNSGRAAFNSGWVFVVSLHTSMSWTGSGVHMCSGIVDLLSNTSLFLSEQALYPKIWTKFCISPQFQRN